MIKFYFVQLSINKVNSKLKKSKELKQKNMDYKQNANMKYLNIKIVS